MIRPWNHVLASVNASGESGTFTFMMLNAGHVVSRRYVPNATGPYYPSSRDYHKRHLAPEFRDEETLRYIVEHTLGYKILEMEANDV